jgi:hypothetical protein
MPEPGGGSVNPFGRTAGIGCSGRPAAGVRAGLGLAVGASVVATMLGVGAGARVRLPGKDMLQALSQTTSKSGATRPYRLRRSDRGATPEAYVDSADSELPPSRDSYARRAPQTAAREHGLTCPVALIRTTTESAGG